MDNGIPVDHCKDQLADHGNAELEARIFLEPREIHRHHGDKAQIGLLKGLSEQVDIVRGPASAAGLGDEQADLVGIVASVLDRVDELADDQQGGVAGVVMDVL
ncbi:hypothetical protein SDC9_80163 [bioreactor metagenome]|uniref:Uncharacterized protein n=1 Tax=bioreactor metagenome TaxID=1076179 RepID=A0A644YYG8_9ZZZZ